MNRWILFGSILGFLGVAMGAFGAHALAGSLSERGREIFQTAAHYHLIHALALIGLGVWSASNPSVSAMVAGWAFTFGVLIFSGSLYALAITDIKVLGAITPIGGVAFLVGWSAFAMSAVVTR